MTRSHRFAHRVIWPVLAILIVTGFSLALAWRAPPAPPPAASTETPP